MFAIGIIVFALGIIISIALHEAGHMWSARAFGMKVTRYFIGFGPTLFSWRRKGVEYGVKAIPAGAFVKIVGMTPQDDDVAPGDEQRAMWRYPVWKRTIVLAAGSLTHFALGIVILWLIFAFATVAQPERLDTDPVTVGAVSQCTEAKTQYDPASGGIKACDPATDPRSAASIMGLRNGDVITAFDGEPVHGWDWLTEHVRAAGAQSVTLTVQRGSQTVTATGTLPAVLRPTQEVVDSGRPLSSLNDADLVAVGVLGISPQYPTGVYGPARAFGQTAHWTGAIFSGTFASLKQLPEKIPRLWASLSGAPRDPDTPVSVVGASRIGGELFQDGDPSSFLLLLAQLNVFVGIFNLLPLLPLDGGHIAVAWFERVRSWLYARLGRPDPGRVDYLKLMPVTYVVILIFGGFTLLTVAADIVNPITLNP